MTEWLTEQEHRAWRGLLQMSAQLEARINKDLQEVGGLSKADYDVLVPLSESPHGRLRQYEIGQALSWEQSRLSHHLARMQKRGLVEREECGTDRRGAFVVLTQAGRCAVELVAPAHVASVRALVFDGLTEQQVQALAEVCEHVLSRLAAAGPDRRRGTTSPRTETGP